MKTAISLEDSLMEETDAVAHDLGLSRSGLIAEALRAFLRQRRQSQLTEQLNRAYPVEPNTEERRLIRTFKTKLKIQDAW